MKAIVDILDICFHTSPIHIWCLAFWNFFFILVHSLVFFFSFSFHQINLPGIYYLDDGRYYSLLSFCLVWELLFFFSLCRVWNIIHFLSHVKIKQILLILWMGLKLTGSGWVRFFFGGGFWSRHFESFE